MVRLRGDVASAVLSLAAIAAAWTARAEPVRVVDDLGRAVALAAPAARVVSLAPHLTELLFDLGAGSRVVGTVAYSDHPQAAQAVPRIGDAHAVDLERTAAMRPDLVVAWYSGNPRAQVEQLARLGVPVYRSEPRSLEDIARTLEQFGRLTGHEREAMEAAARFRARLAVLRARHEGLAPLPVFYQVWPRPLLTVSGSHVIGDALRLCGGANVFGALAPLISAVGVEAVVAANPAAIVTGMAKGETGDPFALWRAWPAIDAVRQGHLFVVPTEAMHRHTPRILDAVESLCSQLGNVRASVRRPAR